MTVICDKSNYILNRDVGKIQTKHPLTKSKKTMAVIIQMKYYLVHEEMSEIFFTSNFHITNIHLINDLIGSFHHVLFPWVNS